MRPYMNTDERLYGWYDRPDQPVQEPTYNPAFPGMCLFCGEQTSEANVRTIAMMPTENIKRSYFYRVHSTCHEAASADERLHIDYVIFDSIKHHGD